MDARRTKGAASASRITTSPGILHSVDQLAIDHFERDSVLLESRRGLLSLSEGARLECDCSHM
jgi:hypothetical protein